MLGKLYLKDGQSEFLEWRRLKDLVQKHSKSSPFPIDVRSAEPPDAKEKDRIRKRQPEAKEKARKRMRRPEAKEKTRKRMHTPEGKEKARKRMQTPEAKENTRKRMETPEEKKKAMRRMQTPEAKKKRKLRMQTPGAKEKVATRRQQPEAIEKDRLRQQAAAKIRKEERVGLEKAAYEALEKCQDCNQPCKYSRSNLSPFLSLISSAKKCRHCKATLCPRCFLGSIDGCAKWGPEKQSAEWVGNTAPTGQHHCAEKEAWEDAQKEEEAALDPKVEKKRAKCRKFGEVCAGMNCTRLEFYTRDDLGLSADDLPR